MQSLKKIGSKGAAPEAPQFHTFYRKQFLIDDVIFVCRYFDLATTDILLLIAHGTGHRFVVVCAKCQCPLDAPSLELETLILVKQ